MKGVTGAAAAKTLGISRAALWKAEKAGRIEKLPDGTYDVRACRKALAERTSPKKSHAELPASTRRLRASVQRRKRPAANSYTEAVRQREWLKVKREREAAEVAAGRLLDAGEVMATHEALARRVTEHMLNLPACYSPEIAAAVGCDERKLYSVLERAIKRHLSELSLALSGELQNAAA